MPSGNEDGTALLILSGLPGTGKTTFARELGRRVAIRHIESDAIRQEIFPQPKFTNSENRIVFADVDRRVKRALAAREFAVVDATNLVEGHRARLRGLVAAARVRCFEVRMVAPEAVVRARLRAPREGFSLAGVEVYERMLTAPEASTWPVFVADTRFALEPTLRAVLALLKESR